MGLCRLGDASHEPNGFWVTRARASALLLALVAVLYPYFKHVGWQVVGSESRQAPDNALIARQLHRMYPRLPGNAKILFLHDPLPADWWNMLWIVRLSYGSDTLMVDCAQRIGRPDAVKMATYDHVFDYADGRFFEVTRAHSSAASAPEGAKARNGPPAGEY